MALLDQPLLVSAGLAMAAGGQSAHVENNLTGGDHGISAWDSQAGRARRPSTVYRAAESSELLGHLRRMAHGDHPALAKTYDMMGPIVFSLAVRMLRDRPAAEDVTQDIFIQVWRQAGNYDTDRGSPEAWIMMIARTRILDRLRSRSAGIVLKPVGDRLPDSPDAEDWPDDLAISREHAAHVRRALAELPEDQRVAVELAFFDGLTHVEISEKLKMPLGTIKTRIRLGLTKIHDRLRELLGTSGLGELAPKERV